MSKKLILSTNTKEITKDTLDDNELTEVFLLSSRPPVLYSDALPRHRIIKFYVPNMEIYSDSPMWSKVLLNPLVEQKAPIYFTGTPFEYEPLFFVNHTSLELQYNGFYHNSVRVKDPIQPGRYEIEYKVIYEGQEDLMRIPFQIITLEENLDTPVTNINLYPIPISDELSVRGAPEGAKIYIFDNQNNEMLSVVAGNHVTNINVSSLLPGVYYLSCKGIVEKIVKE